MIRFPSIPVWALILAMLFAGFEGAIEAHAHEAGAPVHADGGPDLPDGASDGDCEPCAHAGAHVLGLGSPSDHMLPLPAPRPRGPGTDMPVAWRDPPPLRPPNASR